MPSPAITRCLVLLLLVQAALAFPDYKDIRDLYELMGKGEQEGSGHAKERKAGYTPSLRLRFGRRSDPAWSEARIWDAQRTV
uniref:Putative short neuropeptide f-like isoform 2 n=1 Tax=Rhipicephalus microplus TaxID=6941 RepID=A0A6M2D590_RHIMP|nr:sNPF [Rhipicephalus microplus]